MVLGEKGEGELIHLIIAPFIIAVILYVFLFGNPLSPEHDGPLELLFRSFNYNETTEPNITLEKTENTIITPPQNRTITPGNNVISDDEVLDLEILNI